jgi:hypothetical protein
LPTRRSIEVNHDRSKHKEAFLQAKGHCCIGCDRVRAARLLA